MSVHFSTVGNCMCRVCSGNPPGLSSFRDFEKEAVEALHNVSSQTLFLDQAKRIDKLRFDTGDEWGEPTIFQTVRRLIFSNPDPDEGLLLFTYGCWLDMQARYVTVWTTYLMQAKNWICGMGPVPRGNFPPTTKHLLLTRETLKKYGTISQWFLQKINEITEKHGHAKGNIYRLAGEICSELYSKPDLVSELRQGVLPNNFSGGDHKRFWMFMMFLRRDNSIVRCLFTRALNKHKGGQKAVENWYNAEFFDPIECELPVDTWVSANWNKVSEKLKMADLQTENTSHVAKKARSFARENGFSPSVFDAILFYSRIE
jgi:hypothetical protein